jgi:hypothetical protein
MPERTASPIQAGLDAEKIARRVAPMVTPMIKLKMNLNGRLDAILFVVDIVKNLFYDQEFLWINMFSAFA